MTVSLAARIEAILYLKGQPLSLTAIAEHAKCDRDAAADALLQLMDDYAHRDSALELLEDERGFCLQLRPALQELVHELLPVDLTTGTLRTLAAIALKGRISQTDLVDLRGSGAYQQVQELVEQGFIQKRRQSNGRSYWLEVTDKFHQYFQTEGANLEALIPARSQSTNDAIATSPDNPEAEVESRT